MNAQFTAVSDAIAAGLSAREFYRDERGAIMEALANYGIQKGSDEFNEAYAAAVSAINIKWDKYRKEAGVFRVDVAICPACKDLHWLRLSGLSIVTGEVICSDCDTLERLEQWMLADLGDDNV